MDPFMFMPMADVLTPAMLWTAIAGTLATGAASAFMGGGGGNNASGSGSAQAAAPVPKQADYAESLLRRKQKGSLVDDKPTNPTVLGRSGGAATGGNQLLGGTR